MKFQSLISGKNTIRLSSAELVMFSRNSFQISAVAHLM